MSKSFKYLMPALALGALPAFAEDPSAAQTAITSIKTELVSVIGDVATAVAAVVVAAVAIWVVPYAWRKLRGGAR